MPKLLLATGGLLLAFLVLDSASEVLAQRGGGAYWGPFSRGNSSGASTFPSGCASGYILRPGGCERLTKPAPAASRKRYRRSSQ